MSSGLDLEHRCLSVGEVGGETAGGRTRPKTVSALMPAPYAATAPRGALSARNSSGKALAPSTSAAAHNEL